MDRDRINGNRMESTEPQPAAPPFKLRWYQYSLRSLFVFMTLCAVACSWFAVKKRQADEQRDERTKKLNAHHHLLAYGGLSSARR